MKKAFEKYQRIGISTADPLRIVVMLYEGAIKNLNQALRLFDDDFTIAADRIRRTQDIVNYLRNSLDHEQGGELASNLMRLYEYIQDQLNQASIHHQKEPIGATLDLLQTLLDGWRGILPAGTTTEADGLGTVSIGKLTGGERAGWSMVG